MFKQKIKASGLIYYRFITENVRCQQVYRFIWSINDIDQSLYISHWISDDPVVIDVFAMNGSASFSIFLGLLWSFSEVFNIRLIAWLARGATGAKLPCMLLKEYGPYISNFGILPTHKLEYSYQSVNNVTDFINDSYFTS